MKLLIMQLMQVILCDLIILIIKLIQRSENEQKVGINILIGYI
jgi:hypothetical protein